MATYEKTKSRLLQINRDLRHIIENASSSGAVGNSTVETWASISDRIERQLAQDTVRIAIVGSIKSGKSTLTNSLFGGDYVKRGAGVVTSIITKVHPGPQVRAQLEFKTWEEVNTEMREALVLFGSSESVWTYEDFDINQEKDRLRLARDLAKLDADQLMADDARDPNSVLLTEYLKGYDRAKGFVSFEPQVKVLEGEAFDKQKEFVGTESLAVYLRDVSLTLQTPEGFGENLEVADCQGSDSPNPLHLAMIQDYLVQTHLIVYVLSSRTGVRQADIHFLTLIKKMGLTKNILFVLNCDFSEHEDLADLQRVSRRVEEELAMILPAPRLFIFSALFNLFKTLESQEGPEPPLSRKDRLRLEQWREERELNARSDEGTNRFLEEVIRKVTTDRYTLLLEANLERLSNVALGMGERLRIARGFLEKTEEEVRGAFVEMERRRKASDQVTMVVRDTLTGTTGKLKQELGKEVDRFFDLRYGEIGQQIFGFIEGYSLSINDYEKDLRSAGFLPTLYRIFQTLQQAANRFIAESITPKIVEFLSDLEQRMEEVFAGVTGPYSLMIEDAVRQHRETLNRLGITTPDRPFRPIRPPEVSVVRGDAHLAMPRLVSTMQYSARIKTEAVLRLGFYNTLKKAKKLFKKKDGEPGSASAIRSLRDSVRRIKEQMQTSIAEHFVDYKENLKHQYVFLLVAAMSDRLYETLTNQMTAFTGNLSDMSVLMEAEREAKAQMHEQFSSMEDSLAGVLQEIGELEKSAEQHQPYERQARAL